MNTKSLGLEREVASTSQEQMNEKELMTINMLINRIQDDLSNDQYQQVTFVSNITKFVNNLCYFLTDSIYLSYFIENSDTFIVDKVVKQSLSNYREMFEAIVNRQQLKVEELLFQMGNINAEPAEPITFESGLVALEFKKILDIKLTNAIQHETQIILEYATKVYEKDVGNQIKCKNIIMNCLTGAVNTFAFIQKLPLNNKNLNKTQLDVLLSVLNKDLFPSWSKQLFYLNKFVFTQLTQNENIIREYNSQTSQNITKEQLQSQTENKHFANYITWIERTVIKARM